MKFSPKPTSMMSFEHIPPNSTNTKQNNEYDQYIQPKIARNAAESQKALKGGMDTRRELQPLAQAASRPQLKALDHIESSATGCASHLSSSLRLATLIQAFKGGHDCDEQTVANSAVSKGCRFKNGNLDIHVVVGSENRFVHISAAVCNHHQRQHRQRHDKGNTRRRSKGPVGLGNYSFMTRIAKINAILPTSINVRICLDKVITVESLDISLLQDRQTDAFFDRLRTFLTSAIYAEKELKKTIEQHALLGHSQAYSSSR